MESNIKYLIIACLFLQIQKQIHCLFVTRAPCCGHGPFSGLSNINSLSMNHLHNGLVLGSEAYPLTSGQPNVGLIAPPPFPNSEEITPESVKAYGCSLLPCLGGTETPVCACNYNTGNVVSFKNNCDVKKHNCRFDTEFKVILDEICPWEFKSRRSNMDIEIDYSDPKYYND